MISSIALLADAGLKSLLTTIVDTNSKPIG
jgi:hypothetical protein